MLCDRLALSDREAEVELLRDGERDAERDGEVEAESERDAERDGEVEAESERDAEVDPPPPAGLMTTYFAQTISLVLNDHSAASAAAVGWT